MVIPMGCAKGGAVSWEVATIYRSFGYVSLEQLGHSNSTALSLGHSRHSEEAVETKRTKTPFPHSLAQRTQKQQVIALLGSLLKMGTQIRKPKGLKVRFGEVST